MIVLDSGALIALERDDRRMWARLKAAAQATAPVTIPAGALAQAWRGGPSQATLARTLHTWVIETLDAPTARAAGVLCGRTGTADIVDATVAIAAAHPEVTAVCTSDVSDLSRLLQALGGNAAVLPT